MTVKIEQLEQFIEDLGRKQGKISRSHLDAEIARKWGCSRYTINGRFDMLLTLGFVELDAANVVPGIFIVNTKKVRNTKKEKEVEEEKEKIDRLLEPVKDKKKKGQKPVNV